MNIRIYYEDTDCGGVVYYANYLKYFERARTEYLEDRGLSVAGFLEEGTQFMVVRAQLDYRSPARYGDTLVIDTHVTDCGKAALTFAHVIRERQSGRVVVEGSATLAAVSLDGKIKRLPPSLVQALHVPSPSPKQSPRRNNGKARLPANTKASLSSRRHSG